MSTLAEVAQLSRLLVEADERVENAEAALALAKEHARRLREEALPGAMTELGLTALELEDGSKITVAEEVYCSIPVDGRDAAHAWLDEHGFGGLIKSTLEVPFGRDEDEQTMLAELVAHMRAAGYQFTAKQAVHPGTLKAWLKEQLRDGAAVPLQLFGARPVTVAKVKLPKGN